MSAVAVPDRLARSQRPRRAWRPILRPLADRVILEFALADDVRSGMARAVALLRREGAVDRIEWWAPSDGPSMQLATAEGRTLGRLVAVPLGPAGNLIVSGDSWGPAFTVALNRLLPVLRRRWAEEQLAVRAERMARRNEALEDFAALVAHELKAPLNAALVEGNTANGVRVALELVDSLLETARIEPTVGARSSVSACLVEALCDLGPLAANVEADPADEFPLPPAALRLVLRNLVANALAAGARHITVSTSSLSGSPTLLVDDDGVGLEGPGACEYAVGSRLGLSLCRRLVERFGLELELAPRAPRGTRVKLGVREVER